MKSQLVSQGSDICKTMPLPSPALYGFGFQLLVRSPYQAQKVRRLRESRRRSAIPQGGGMLIGCRGALFDACGCLETMLFARSPT
jgi:hypothetical protein